MVRGLGKILPPSETMNQELMQSWVTRQTASQPTWKRKITEEHLRTQSSDRLSCYTQLTGVGGRCDLISGGQSDTVLVESDIVNAAIPPSDKQRQLNVQSRDSRSLVSLLHSLSCVRFQPWLPSPNPNGLLRDYLRPTTRCDNAECPILVNLDAFWLAVKAVSIFTILLVKELLNDILSVVARATVLFNCR